MGDGIIRRRKYHIHKNRPIPTQKLYHMTVNCFLNKKERLPKTYLVNSDYTPTCSFESCLSIIHTSKNYINGRSFTYDRPS